VENDFLAQGFISRPNQVWRADISYIPVKHGFLYLVAIMDWATRKVLAWRLANSAESFAIGPSDDGDAKDCSSPARPGSQR